jgi:hypothetical protein
VPQLVSILVVIGSIPPIIWLLRQPPVDGSAPPSVPGRIPVRRE